MIREFFLRMLHPRKVLDDAVQTAISDQRSTRRRNPHELGEVTEDEHNGALARLDPLDPRSRGTTPALFGDGGKILKAEDFPRESQYKRVGDGAIFTADNAVSGSGELAAAKGNWSSYGVPEALMGWYASQSFIGYQSCAIIAQHWLVDKACTMPGEDATRNGYAVTINSDATDNPMHPDKVNEYVAKIQDYDNDYNVTDEMIQFWRFVQIFGIRVALFEIESDDPQYYEKPFNIDGVTSNSYKGIRQIDPYWMMPILSNSETSDPTSPHFYDPSYWIISGKKYHRSHLIIGRGPEPADILKPTYIFGGISLVQRIYERTYAAERTANEGPLLTVTKRTTVLKTNLAMAEAQPQRFERRLMKWAGMRDNYGVKTVNTDDNVEQLDTSLADLDKTIMNQYQLVSAISKTPAVKLLGTSPSGFNATGEQETKSYHEHLESVQKFLTPLLTRHHELLCRSKFGVDLPIKHTWNRVDSFTAKELAELNMLKAQTGEILATSVAAISPDEERNRLKNDPLSGYGHLGDVEAETEIGATPENEQGAVEAGAKEVTAEAAAGQPDAQENVIGMESEHTMQSAFSELATIIRGLNGEYDPADILQQVEGVLADMVSSAQAAPGTDIAQITDIVAEIISILQAGQKTVHASVQPSTHNLIVDNAKGARVGDGNQAGLPANGGVNFSHRDFKQVKAGRYTISVENPRGSIRSGEAKDGTKWRSQMPYDYGFINNTKGADAGEVDVFVGPNVETGKIYIINQIEPTTGEFDEHKVMWGFDNELFAKVAYKSAYQRGWEGFASIHEVTPGQFSEWLSEDDLTLPYRDLHTG